MPASATIRLTANRGWHVIHWIQKLIITLGTLPYYRFFRQNTLLPIQHIAKCAQRGDNGSDLVGILKHWRERKLYELQFIQVASTILAAAVIGCFSWQPVSDEFWIGPAFWYCALVLSVVAILLSSSQAFIFHALNSPSAQLNSGGDYRRYLALILVVPPETPQRMTAESMRGHNQDYAIRWKMVFTWQAPMMLMAYAVMFFLAGLTVYVCTPLFNGESTTPGGKISIFYLVVSALTGGIFVFCSFWAYRFIDLDKVAENTSENVILPMPYHSSSFAMSPPTQSATPTDVFVKRPEAGD